MPFKHNANCRHHIRKMRFRVTNWRQYEQSLKQRGSLTFWIEPESLEQWQKSGPGGQARYRDMAIQSALVIRGIFRLPYRQTEGLMGSLMRLMKLPVQVPDHTTLSRRSSRLSVRQEKIPATGPLDIRIDSTGLKVYGAGQWLEDKHGQKSARRYMKLHLAVDSGGHGLAVTLTDQYADDASQVEPLLSQIPAPVSRMMADGAYDRYRVYKALHEHSPEARAVIPPRAGAVPDPKDPLLAQRNQHILSIRTLGHLPWQIRTGYGQRSRAENTIGRYKSLIGTRLRARTFPAQKTEAAVGVFILNRMLASGRPHSVRRSPKVA